MDSISNVNSVTESQRKSPGEVSVRRRVADQPPTPSNDSAVFSHAGLQLARSDDLLDVRAALIDRVRSEIADGRFETRDRLDGTVDRVLADLNKVDIHV